MIKPLVRAGLAIAFLAATSTVNASIVFDADFEAGTTAANTGVLTFDFDTTLPGTTVGTVPTSTAGTPNGSNALLVDDFTSDNIFAELTLDFDNAVSLTNGNTATFSFSTLVRRSGTATQRTQFVTGFDSNGVEVFQFVLNDGDFRQNPRFGTAAGGIQAFASGPGNFFYGADGSTESVNTNQFAEFELTIGGSSFDFEGTNQNGTTFTDTGISLFNGGSATDLASIVISADRTAPANNLTSGNYYDNFLVNGVIVVPEPNSLLALIAFAPALLLKRRR